MYVAIRGLKAKPGFFDEALRRIENGFVPLVSSMPGFVMYDVARIGEDEGMSLSFFETQEQAEESNRRALEWTRENLAPLAAGPHQIVAGGEVLVHKGK